jgi:hypothetical protein
VATQFGQPADALSSDPIGTAIDLELLPGDTKQTRRAAQLLESPGMTHEVTLLLGVEHALGVFEQRAVHPWWGGRAQVDLYLDRHGRSLTPQGTADLRRGGRRHGLPGDAQLEVAERLDHVERHRPGSEDPRPAI